MTKTAAKLMSEAILKLGRCRMVEAASRSNLSVEGVDINWKDQKDWLYIDGYIPVEKVLQAMIDAGWTPPPPLVSN